MSTTNLAGVLVIEVDIGGHPPIPFGPAPLILAAFHIQHNLLFLAGFRVLHSQSRFGALMIQVDIGGHPSSPFEHPPSVISVCKFRHNLQFLAVFRVLNFRSRFEALNDVFGKTESNMGPWIDVSHSKVVLLGQIFPTSY